MSIGELSADEVESVVSPAQSRALSPGIGLPSPGGHPVFVDLEAEEVDSVNG